jgi:RNA polymerase sigma-70 factor (ECF subfamily)
MKQMSEHEWLAEQFEANRSHLRGVAFRMLGSLSEAEDAVQEAWLRLSHADASGIENLGGWLTTVVARVSLDMLRSRAAHREEPMETHAPEPVAARGETIDPEEEALMADSVGLALLVVLETLAPAERLAFVLHDLFALPFDEIAPIVGRSEAAARQLASRARRRVQGSSPLPGPSLGRQGEVVEAFLAASRRGDFEALLALLDPEVVLRSDASILPPGAPRELHGASLVADRAIKGGARAARAALVDSSVGIVVAPRGRLLMVLRVTVAEGRIAAIEAIGDSERLRQLELAVLDR